MWKFRKSISAIFLNTHNSRNDNIFGHHLGVKRLPCIAVQAVEGPAPSPGAVLFRVQHPPQTCVPHPEPAGADDRRPDPRHLGEGGQDGPQDEPPPIAGEVPVCAHPKGPAGSVFEQLANEVGSGDCWRPNESEGSIWYETLCSICCFLWDQLHYFSSS